MITGDSVDVASVMSSADVACYSAKDMGRNQVYLYKDSDASLRHEEMKWVSRITNAVEEDRFLEFVIDELKIQNLPDGAICFEITETAAISNLSRVVHFMQTLKQLGCKFSLDDFGSGLSSFTYLKNLPVDYLKIDGHFIRNVAEDAVDESMVRAISEVGHAMGIQTIAERVETRQVLEKLATLGVEFAQGYYIARPASVQTFDPWGEKAERRLA